MLICTNNADAGIVRTLAAFGCLVSALAVPCADAEPLAECGVNTSVAVSQPMANALLLGLGTDNVDEQALGYHRSPAGDWLVPEEVDPADDLFRGVLLAPGGPLVIEFHVRCQGRSFRHNVEAWIDTALDPAAEVKDSNATNDAADAEAMEELPAGMVDVQRFVPAEATEWLANYARQSPDAVDRYEARWLLAQRLGGPALMQLTRFSTDRRAAAPLWQLLDQYGDQQLSRQEILRTDELLRNTDVDQDGNVSLSELERAKPDTAPPYRAWRVEPLLAVLDDDESAERLSLAWQQQLSDHSDVASKIAPQQMVELMHRQPDLQVSIAFDDDRQKSRVAVMGVGANLQSRQSTLRTTSTAIGLSLQGCELEIEAAQDGKASAAAQVSVGASVEGFPLLGLVDSNGDTRLSIRERSAMTEVIGRLDADDDGNLTASEIPCRLRLAVALGPVVHDLLSLDTPRLAPYEKPASNAPAWFTSMDLDHDGDLTRREFLGSRTKFDELDKNDDGLVSHTEVAN